MCPTSVVELIDRPTMPDGAGWRLSRNKRGERITGYGLGRKNLRPAWICRRFDGCPPGWPGSAILKPLRGYVALTSTAASGVPSNCKSASPGQKALRSAIVTPSDQSTDVPVIYPIRAVWSRRPLGIVYTRSLPDEDILLGM